MQQMIPYIPIGTTIFSLIFFYILLTRYFERKTGPHLIWWAAGVLTFGIGTLTESLVSVFGWREFVFRSWYISGALLGGFPLAQGTVYLLLARRTANRMTKITIPFIAIAAFFVMITPLDLSLVESHRLSGKIIEWTWVRFFSPFINTYAFIFLVGGAVLSAYRFRKKQDAHHRFVGNCLIAVGALLPGIGGSFTRFGYTEVLYVTEFIGIVLIYAGYRYNVKGALLTSREIARNSDGSRLSALQHLD